MSGESNLKELEYPHFAIIYLDWHGNLHHEASPSIRDDRGDILSSEVTKTFLQAVACSGEAHPSSSQPMAGATTSSTSQSPSCGHIPLQPLLCRAAESPETLDHRGYEHGPTGIRTPTYPVMWSLQHQQQDRQSQKQSSSIRSSQQVLISIRDKEFLRRYYQRVFLNLQQTNCKLLAKAYVKLIEPRKQNNYPYNGRKIIAGRVHQLKPDETKPPWWPSGVSHREPDHLLRADRIRLLVHILCELHTSHGVTTRRLKEADQPIRLQISPAERLQLLDEVYRVREEEEKFQEGLTDGKAMVSIAGANLPDPVKAIVNRGLRGTRDFRTEDPSTRTQGTEKEAMAAFSSPIQGNIATPSVSLPAPIPSSLSITTHHPFTHRYSEFLSQGVIPTINYDPISSSMSQQDHERKFASPSSPATTSLHTVEFYQPMFVNPQCFIQSSYGEIYGFCPQVVFTTGPSGAEQYEHMDSHVSPYYYDDTGLGCLGFQHWSYHDGPL